MKRRLVPTVIALATVFSLGCSDDGTRPTPASFAGTWNLQTVNGLPMPFVLQPANPKVEIVSDQIVVLNNGTFTESFVVQRTTGTQVVIDRGTDSGTYSLNGSSVSLVYANGSTGNGATSANNLTLAGQGFAQVYMRQ